MSDARVPGEGDPVMTPPQALGFGRLFEAARDAVVVSDADGRIVLWNPRATTMFGHEASEAIGRSVDILVPPRFRSRHHAGMARFRETGTGPMIASGAILQLPALRKDGSEVVVEMTLSRIDGGLVMAILRDVTQRVRLEEETAADRERLREANEALEAFSYIVGHDLKEPVRAVNVYLEAALEAGGVSPEAEAHIRRAADANLRMATLLGGLLDWSRATIGGVDPEPIDLRATVLTGACRTRYQHLVEERGAQVRFVGEAPPVRATENLVCQLFGNLVINALRHNPKPNPEVEIAALGARDGLLEIAVRDNGPGFPPEVRRRIDALRGNRPSTVRGGFGLTIATRAARVLGGRIAVGENPGGGAAVHVWLPIA